MKTNMLPQDSVVLLELTVEGVALFLRSAETTGLAGTFVVELPDEPFLPESSAPVLLSTCPPLLE